MSWSMLEINSARVSLGRLVTLSKAVDISEQKIGDCWISVRVVGNVDGVVADALEFLKLIAVLQLQPSTVPLSKLDNTVP